MRNLPFFFNAFNTHFEPHKHSLIQISIRGPPQNIDSRKIPSGLYVIGDIDNSFKQDMPGRPSYAILWHRRPAPAFRIYPGYRGSVFECRSLTLLDSAVSVIISYFLHNINCSFNGVLLCRAVSRRLASSSSAPQRQLTHGLLLAAKNMRCPTCAEHRRCFRAASQNQALRRRACF